MLQVTVVGLPAERIFCVWAQPWPVADQCLAVTVGGIAHHSDIRLATRVETVLDKFIVTPGIHWLHHHALREDTNSNYAVILSGWDRIFGSGNRRYPDMVIGVAGELERSLFELLLSPFKSAGNKQKGVADE